MSQVAVIIVVSSGDGDIGRHVVRKLEQEFDSHTLRIIVCSLECGKEDNDDKERVDTAGVSSKDHITTDNKRPSVRSVSFLSFSSSDETTCQQLFDLISTEAADGLDLLINLTGFVDNENNSSSNQNNSHGQAVLNNYESTRNLTDKLLPLMKDNGRVILLSRPVTLFHLIGGGDENVVFNEAVRRKVLSADAQRSDLDDIVQRFKQQPSADHVMSQDRISHVLTMIYTLILRQELSQEAGKHVEAKCICFGQRRSAAQVADLVIETIRPSKTEYDPSDDEMSECSTSNSYDSCSTASFDSRNKLRLISWILYPIGRFIS